MTGLWVTVGILAFLALLLSVSVTVTVRITDEVRVWIGALGYRYPLLPPRRKQEAGPEAEQPPEKASEGSGHKARKKGEKPGERSFSETVELAATLLRSLLPPAGRMLRHIRFTGVRIYMTVAREEADQTAIAYGAVSAGVYNLLGMLDSLFTLRVKWVDILPDFVSGEPVYRISFRAKLRVGCILAGALRMLYNLAVNTIFANRGKKGEPGGPSDSPAKTSSC